MNLHDIKHGGACTCIHTRSKFLRMLSARAYKQKHFAVDVVLTSYHLTMNLNDVKTLNIHENAFKYELFFSNVSIACLKC